MIKLNIIPQKLRKEKKVKAIYNSLKLFYIIIFIICAVYASVFMLLESIMKSHFVKTVNETTLLIRNTESSTNQLTNINSQISFIDNIQKNNIRWSNLLKLVSKNIPDEVKLNDLKTSRDNDSLHMSGNAGTRDALIKLKENLDELGLFEEIELPRKSLFEKNNINFEINVKLKSYDF